jgi:hypothetical protein
MLVRSTTGFIQTQDSSHIVKNGRCWRSSVTQKFYIFWNMHVSILSARYREPIVIPSKLAPVKLIQAYNLKNRIKFLSSATRFPKGHCFLKPPVFARSSFRCIWMKTLLCIGWITLTGKTEVLGQKQTPLHKHKDKICPRTGHKGPYGE